MAWIINHDFAVSFISQISVSSAIGLFFFDGKYLFPWANYYIGRITASKIIIINKNT